MSGTGIKLASEAVIIFFVLSGYLVGGSVVRALGRKRWSWEDYLIKRLTRLWVPLIPCLLLCMVLDHTGYHIFGDASIYHNPPGIDLITSFDLIHRWGPSTLIANLLFLQGFRAPIFGTDNSLWSLSNEFWYYLVFPCLALAFATGRSALLRTIYLLLAVAMLIFVTPSIAILFPIWVLGAVVAMLPRPLSPLRAKQGCIVAALGLLLTMGLVRVLVLPSIVAEYLVAIATSAFLWPVIQQCEPASRNLYAMVATFFSKISYTLYIVHLPVAIFLASAVNSPWRRWDRTPLHLAVYLGLDLAVLAVATVLWKLFESNTDKIRLRLFHGNLGTIAPIPGA